MKIGKTHLIAVLVLATLLSASMIYLGGCKKKTETSASTALGAIEQTVCPVMGNPINKDIYVEYQGKKVYFCCEECKAKFEAEPEKYLAKLPQFSK